ncbi:MAG: hypothetical protein JNN27_02215 [Planctomycetes bacterium]|nr:hypothetical protein [Planctomycetota bacterium]
MTAPDQPPPQTPPTSPPPSGGTPAREEPSVWRFTFWSAVSLSVVITLGVLVARLLHELGLD